MSYPVNVVVTAFDGERVPVNASLIICAVQPSNDGEFPGVMSKIPGQHKNTVQCILHTVSGIQIPIRETPDEWRQMVHSVSVDLMADNAVQMAQALLPLRN